MGIAEEMRHLAGLAGQTGHDEIRQALLRLCERGAELEGLLTDKEAEIAELRQALEAERAMRSPRPEGILALRCPNWRVLLHRIVGWAPR